MRAALAFDRPDVDAFLCEMTPYQWAEWKTFFRLEPHGGLHDELRAGTIVAMIHNAGFTKKPIQPHHVFPVLKQLAPVKRYPSWQEQRDKIKAMAMAGF